MKVFITLLVVTSYLKLVYAVNPNRTCSSYNDPHMTNFGATNFEMHQNGVWCLYNSGLVEVFAGFSSCSPPNAAPTCNCMVQVRISAAGPFQFNYLTIDTCTSSVWNVETSSSTFVTCPSLMASNAQLFNDAWWASQPTTQVFPGFACTQTLSGATAIRTYFSLADDVLVLAYPGWITMNSIEVYGSNSYFTTSQFPNDRCLCGSYVTNTDRDCRSALNDKCFNDVVVGTDTRFRAFVEKLIDDCEKDAGLFPTRNGDGTIGNKMGMFQRQLLEAKKLEFLIQKFNKKTNDELVRLPALTDSDEAWIALEKYCVCKGQRPNKDCFFNGKCDRFKICL